MISIGHAMPPFTEKNEADSSDEGLPAPQRYFALAAVLAAMVLVVLDSAIANVALPTIAGALQSRLAHPSGLSSDISWLWSSPFYPARRLAKAWDVDVSSLEELYFLRRPRPYVHCRRPFLG
jgi:DHA2 family multidrug resistance protein-like MFS transporter